MKKPCCCPVCNVACVLVLVGAINWGLIGVFGVNIVSQLLGAGSMAEKIVYIVVGLAGVIKLLGCFITLPCAKACNTDKSEGGNCHSKK